MHVYVRQGDKYLIYWTEIYTRLCG